MPVLIEWKDISCLQRFSLLKMNLSLMLTYDVFLNKFVVLCRNFLSTVLMNRSSLTVSIFRSPSFLHQCEASVLTHFASTVYLITRHLKYKLRHATFFFCSQ